MAKIIPGPQPALKELTRANLRPNVERRHGSGGAEIRQCECSRMRWLLQCRLAWYGLRAVGVGSLRDLAEKTVLVDLVQDGGSVVCSVKVDRQYGIVDSSAGRALTRLLNAAA